MKKNFEIKQTKEKYEMKEKEVDLMNLSEEKENTIALIFKYLETMGNILRWIEKEETFYLYSNNVWIKISTNELLNNFTTYAKNNEMYKLCSKTACSQFIHIVKTQSPFFNVSWPVNEKINIPLKNGVLDLETKKLKPHFFKENNKFILPFNWLEEKITTDKFPEIFKWLQFITNNDPLFIDFLLKLIYQCLTGNKNQFIINLVGPGGTGKSTLILLIKSLIGNNNMHPTNIHTLENNRFETSQIKDKLVVVVNDSAHYTGEISVLKSISGGDPIRYEEKFKASTAPFVFYGVGFIVSNEIIKPAGKVP